MKGSFVPIKHEPPTTLFKKIKYYGRMLLDLQILTIYKDLRIFLPKIKGKVLDVGCGQSPYKHLLNENETEYWGIDIAEASHFGYLNKDITLFDGTNIPFTDNSFDAILCTEVIEHVYDYQKLVDEIYRVCKINATGIITIPFSSRYHYIPNDFFRYTPSALEIIFSKFSKVEICYRGSDVTSICGKIIVLFFTNFTPNTFSKIICLPFWLLMTPILGIVVVIGHISIIFDLGSEADPLGYTIKIIK